ncbi:unnamed protein product [Clonostachys rosea]|uniref:SGNH hydrolase-type esterase domain-containing protein n=1 Tax=Bionectria ochroleuca TaxID=29856 RepID=A0ABY6V4L7_BIOOC|nr:unnamed protein product [Clonostachys rosea]
MPVQSLFPRDTLDFDADDLTYLKKMAAVRDSYSAGIGSGSPLERSYHEWNCRRYDQFYPWLINQNPRLGASETRSFQFESCSGAVTQDVIDKQIPVSDSNQQVILFSAGGNDVELTNILNQCIYQWAAFNPAQVAVAKIAALKNESWSEWIDFEKYGRGCEGQIGISMQLINSPWLSSQRDTTIEAAKKKLASEYVKGSPNAMACQIALIIDQRLQWLDLLYWCCFIKE